MADKKHLMHTNSSLSWKHCNTFSCRLQLVGAHTHIRPWDDVLNCPPHPVGKSYASKVDDEKTAFEQRSKHRQNGHKNSRYLHCSCFCRYGRVAVIYEEILISMWDGSIIQLDKLEFDEQTETAAPCVGGCTISAN